MTIAHSVIEGIAGIPVAPQAKGAGVLVATYNDGVDYIVASSPDNETWTTRINLGSDAPGVVLWTGAAFFFVSDDGANYTLHKSADGITWTTPYSGALYTAVLGAGNGHLFIVQDGVTYRTSDGATLSAVSFSYSGSGTAQVPRCVAYNTAEGIYGAITSDGADGSFFLTSAAGLVFSEVGYSGSTYNSLLYFSERGEFFLNSGDNFYVSADLASLTLIPIQDSKTLSYFVAPAIDVGEYLVIQNGGSFELPEYAYALRAAGTEFEPIGTPDPEDGNFVNYSYMWSSMGPAIADNTVLFGDDASLGLITLGEPAAAPCFWTNFIGQYAVAG